MRTLYCFACIAVSAISFAQSDFQVLHQNNVSAFINNSGTIFHNFQANPADYEVPRGSGHKAIYGARFWFGGQDINGIPHTTLGGINAAATDVFPGPYSSTNDYSASENWKVWTMCQSEIDNFIKWHNATLPGADTSLQFTTPTDEFIARLSSWPAHGDLQSGQALNIAPFFDRLQDGFYDPAQGDYPIIKGCCATYMVQNDAASLHSLSSSAPVGLEMHYLIYQYESGDFINDATFIDVTAINRGYLNYPEFAHGFMADADLGYSMDDFMGSDSTNSMLYFYNGNNNDEGNYGQNPPALGIVSLNNMVSSCTPLTSGSYSSSQSWNILNGKQSSGAEWIHPDNYASKFVFSGDPDNAAEWSEINTSGTPGDRLGIITHANGSFGPGDTIFQSYAILYARSGDHLAAVQTLKQQAAAVKLFYTNDTLACGPATAGITEKQKIKFTVRPNPSKGFITLEPDAKEIQVSVLQTDGKTVFNRQLKTGEKTLDLSALPTGLYFLKIDSEEGSDTQKIILN
ncbi:MAG: hypothetical protein K0R65_2487 [Crocinitomicaceae bacterium]|jgi:hypothetical protein|nr:hypothetical protein [Crocinitomicaceae bacterium]